MQLKQSLLMQISTVFFCSFRSMGEGTFQAYVWWWVEMCAYSVKVCYLWFYISAIEERYYVGPCHHGMAQLQVADGGDGLQIWRVGVTTLNKHLLTADKGW